MSSLDPSNSPTPLEEPSLTLRVEPAPRPRRRIPLWFKLSSAFIALLALAGIGGFFGVRHWAHQAAVDSLPQVDGSLAVPGLSASVTVQRDAHGVPHIVAANLDDLLLAQGYVTAQDRLWQMDLMRRHAGGELAAILGSRLLQHDKTQRTLRLREVAEQSLSTLPPDQFHQLEVYAKGVNASIDDQRAHLPLEFRILHYEPAPWTPRDSLLVGMVMFQDLTTAFPDKLAREALSARLTPDLAADLYPVGSWRDHPPGAGVTDLTIEGPPIEEVPLDESQNDFALNHIPSPADAAHTLEVLTASLGNPCPSCVAGSNNWVVAGTKTASGKPLLSDDMHLHLSVPETWYEASLEATNKGSEPFHVAGVSLPGVPFIIVGHNQHIAWGFTNLYADVQDLYIEQTRGSGTSEEFSSTSAAGDVTWQPIQRHDEVIAVRGAKDVTFDVATTRHGDTETPILTPILPKENRTISLRWTAYDPGVFSVPFYAINSAHDWASFNAAFAQFGGPGQNAVYADDQGHIGYHAVGRVPIRGPRRAVAQIPSDLASPTPETSSNTTPTIAATPNPLTGTDIASPTAKVSVPMIGGPLSPVPVRPTPQNEWSGYIPYDELPQVFDPPGGVLATANARIAPDDYPYPLTLDWAAPYRNERIWRTLIKRDHLTPNDMLALENDVYSDLDHVLAERFAYAIDHSEELRTRPANQQKGLRQAADILRKWNGRMDANASAPAIVSAAHEALWRILLTEHVRGKATPADLQALYLWGQKDYALEQIVMHQPPRWLSPHFETWNDLLASAVDKGLADAHAPTDLSKWQYGRVHTLDIEHPVFSLIPHLERILGMRFGTGPRPLAGDHSTVKQTDKSFGPSERLTVDFANLDNSTLNIVLGESGNPLSPWFMDQFPSWYRAATYKLPFSADATTRATSHTLTLQPR